jgi:hypothetical protein
MRELYAPVLRTGQQNADANELRRLLAGASQGSGEEHEDHSGGEKDPTSLSGQDSASINHSIT